MSLIKCKQCEKEIDDHLKECPFCGTKNNMIICKGCNNEIFKKAKKCPYCGTKIRESKLTLSIAIFLILIASIAAIFLIGYSTNLDYCFFEYNYNSTECLLQGKFMLGVNIVTMIASVFLIFKLFKNKAHILIKIMPFICIVITIVSSSFYIPKYLYAKKLDHDYNVKQIVDDGYSVNQAKKIKNELYDILFSDLQINQSEYYIKEMIISSVYESSNNGYKTFLCYPDAYSDYDERFAFEVKIDNNYNIESVYWPFNEEIKLFLYQDYKKTDNRDYYIKVIMNHYIDELNYDLKVSIEKDIKEMLKSPSSAEFNYILRYYSNTNTLCYFVTVDSQNSFGAMVRTDFRVDFKNTNSQKLDYTIRVVD